MVRQERSNQAEENMIFTFKENHSMHTDDDSDNDDNLFVLNIGIAQSSVCATGREKLISSSGTGT